MTDFAGLLQVLARYNVEFILIRIHFLALLKKEST
jgi:hypothetical protein